MKYQAIATTFDWSKVGIVTTPIQQGITAGYADIHVPFVTSEGFTGSATFRFSSWQHATDHITIQQELLGIPEPANCPTCARLIVDCDCG